MARNDFLKKIEQDINTFENAIKDCAEARRRIKKLEKASGLSFRKHKFNYKGFVKLLVNDSNFTYTLRNFLIDAERFNNTVSRYKDLAFDLAKIKDMVNSQSLKDETFFFASLSFYSINFEAFIRILQPMANAIQKHYHYLKDNKGNHIKKITNAAGTLSVMERFNPRFHRLLTKFLDRRMRNHIAHADFEIEGQDFVYYTKIKCHGKDYKRKNRVPRETIIRMIAQMGDVINHIQCLYYELCSVTFRKILKQKLQKKEIRSFLNDMLI